MQNSYEKYRISRTFHANEAPGLIKNGWTLEEQLDDQKVRMSRIDIGRIKRNRAIRKKKLGAYDVYRINALFHKDKIATADKGALEVWYQRVLDLEEEAILETPDLIRKYL